MATERELEQCDSLSSCSTVTTLERLQLCCKPTYKPRRVKNKGAILVLVWNFMIMSVYGMLDQYLIRQDRILFRVWVVVFGLTPPIAGWLADARVGRYKVMRCSIWIMWIAAVLTTASSVISQLIDAYSHIDMKMQAVLLVFTAVGLGGYQANIIQFGLDQLQDASTIEITSFIVWYVWTTVSACLVVNFSFTCLSEEQNIITWLFVCLNLTLALLLLLRCNPWLLKEPVKENPFRLIYKVIKYAIKHKHPCLRSAFTYCEDNPPSRIDFGKIKYGGPFTTEQVEDVKTFLRLIPVAIVGGVLGGGLFTTDYLRDKVYEVITDFDNLEALRTSDSGIKLTECYHKASFSHTVYYSSVVLIVIYEVLVYPVLYRCLPHWIESLQKIIIGMLLQITRVLVLLSYVLILHLTSQGQIQCLFNLDKSNIQAQNTTFSYYWIAIPDFIETISVAMVYIGAAEFLSSQTPNNMRGIMIGATYCSLFVSSGVWFVLLIPFTRNSSIWGTRIINCGFWLSLILAIIQVCVCLLLMLLARWYKKRRRQDVLPNEHIFAERYYSIDT